MSNDWCLSQAEFSVSKGSHLEPLQTADVPAPAGSSRELT